MATSDVDQTTNPSSASDNGPEMPESAEELKMKFQGSGSGDHVANHVGQNGFSNMNNHIDEKNKESKPKEHHSSSSKHKESSSKHRESSSSSSSSKHKDGSSKHRDHHHHHSSSSSSSKHREGHSSSSSSSKHKDGHSSSSKSKDGSSSSSKPKDPSARPKEGSSSSDKQKDGSHSKDKHHSSSSEHRHRDKHKESSSKSSPDKHKEKQRDGSSNKSPEKHRPKEGSSSKDSSDKHKDRPKEGSSRSPDKHKEKLPSKHKDDDKQKDGPKKSSSKHKNKDKDRHKEKSQEEKHMKKEYDSMSSPDVRSSDEMKVKVEPSSPVKMEMKKEPVSDDDDDKPLSARMNAETKAPKRHLEESDDDDEPLSSRMEKVKKVKKEDDVPKAAKKRKAEDDDDFKVSEKKKKKKDKEKGTKVVKEEPVTPTKGKRKKEDEQQVWRWWEEERKDDGVKWKFLEHKGPVFAPLYEALPKSVKFYYNGKEMRLMPETEEVATFYAKMLEHDYCTRQVFNNNFFKDWRKVMSSEEKEKIKDLSKCDFKEMAEYFKMKTEERKQMTKEEKLAIKKQNEETVKIYGFCTIDGHTEKIGNFKIEPPGLFRGRGDHPKQGMLKRRVQPEDVIINCSRDCAIPKPPEGHKWKEVRHDNTVTWLASWAENIQGQTKYVMLNAASKLKGEKDWQKYEVARRLHKCVDKIRATYREDWKSKEMRIRQRAVALYFIDKLALRAGNEKEEGETADTVGCCSLRVEHIKLHEEDEGKECVVEFDFLGKDSIRYQNKVAVEKRVFKNLQLFMNNKQPGDDLFDRLNTAIMNKHLHDLMDGLTAKVFRTYNASRTLQEQLDLLTNADDSIPAKILSYNRANRAVAILCNHQRAVPKTFQQSMENLMKKIDDKKKQVKEAKKALKDAKSDYKAQNTERARQVVEKRKKALGRIEEQLVKLEVQATDKDENKEIALGTSKLNYLDPRISVAWCKKWDVPIEKIYNKTQRDKFRWAIDMATAEFVF